MRLVWFGVLGLVIAFAVQTFFGSVIEADTEVSTKRVSAYGTYRDGQHHIEGMAMVPTSCHTLTVRVRDITPNSSALVFETWEQPYAVDCVDEPTPKRFAISVFAPGAQDFQAILDNNWVSLALVRR